MKRERNPPDPEAACCVRCKSAVDRERDRYEYMAMASERETLMPLGVGVWYKLEQSGFVQLSAFVCRPCIARVRRRHLRAWLAGLAILSAVLVILGVLRPSGMVWAGTIIGVGAVVLLPLLIVFTPFRAFIGQREAIAVNKGTLKAQGFHVFKGGNPSFRQHYNGLPLGH